LQELAQVWVIECWIASLEQPTSPPTRFWTHSLRILPAAKMHLFCWELWHPVTVAFRANYKSTITLPVHYITDKL